MFATLLGAEGWRALQGGQGDRDEIIITLESFHMKYNP
jgi:hypothetical protein